MKKLKELMTPKRIFLLLIFILVLIFGFQNMRTVKLSIVFFSIEMPLLVLILVLYVIGVLTGWAVKRSDVKKIVDNAQLETQKEIKELQEQLNKK